MIPQGSFWSLMMWLVGRFLGWLTSYCLFCRLQGRETVQPDATWGARRCLPGVLTSWPGKGGRRNLRRKPLAPLLGSWTAAWTLDLGIDLRIKAHKNELIRERVLCGLSSVTGSRYINSFFKKHANLTGQYKTCEFWGRAPFSKPQNNS